MKKFSPVLVVGLLLTMACFVLYLYEPLFIRSICLYAYDAFMRSVARPPQSDRVALVDIDEASLDKYGQWPWSRDLIARLTQGILERHASVVAFDVVFPEPDGKSPCVLRGVMSARYKLDVKIDGVPDDLTDFDRMFAEVLRKSKSKTILGCYMHTSDAPVADVPDVDRFYRGFFYLKGPRQAGDVNRFMQQAGRMTISIPMLNEAAGNNAFYNAIPDADNVVRRNPLIMAYGTERIYPALAVEAVRMAMNIDQIGLEYYDQGIERLRLRNIAIPTDAAGRLIVNFRKLVSNEDQEGFHSFPTYSAAKVLEGEIGAESLSNKIVFVGTSAPGLRDMRATPLTPEFAGVEVHATIVDNILSGDMLYQPAWIPLIDTVAIVFMGLFLTMLLHRGRALLSFLVTALALLAAIEGSYMLFAKLNFVFVPVRLVVSTIIIYPILTMIKYWQEEQQKKQVRNMFGTMVSLEVLRYMENNPGSFTLTGQKAEATMFFSDVAGFTRISEALEPVKLSVLLNRYLSPMTQIIMDRKGYVDKYEGDLIMAEWGVPFAMEDHAAQACLAALEQQAKLAELRPVLKAEFGHEIHVRMGINSGSVTAGNMGSDRRFNYTVLGDAVNLASRLEPVNGDYGTRIIISEFTYEKAQGGVEARLLDKIVVTGKAKPVCIYELLGKHGQVQPEVIRMARLYEEAVRLHWERQWDEAIARFEELLRIRPDDVASREILGRIVEYRKNPPPQAWAGEYVRASKH
jgi:adenylate cyclase